MQDTIAAAEFLEKSLIENANALTTIGFRWLRHAQQHLEEQIEASLRGWR